MIPSRVRIEDGPMMDFFEEFGFIYISADNRTAPPEKQCDVTAYPEKAGENADDKTVDDAFDYTVTFLVEAPNKDLVNANAKITAFNNAIRERTGTGDIKRCKEITFYNDFKRVRITGVPEPIAEPTDFYRRRDGNTKDCVKFDLKIRVNDPNKCDFNMSADESYDRLEISLTPVGQDIRVGLSRALNENEHVVLLRKGSAKKRNPRYRKGEDFPKRVMRRHRWQVYYKYTRNEPESYYWPFYLSHDGLLWHVAYGGETASRLWCFSEYHIRKSQASKKYLNYKKPMVTYGVAVYRNDKDNKEKFQRVSEVKYFTSLYEAEKNSTRIVIK